MALLPATIEISGLGQDASRENLLLLGWYVLRCLSLAPLLAAPVHTVFLRWWKVRWAMHSAKP